jgi:hypothetical protein
MIEFVDYVAFKATVEDVRDNLKSFYAVCGLWPEILQVAFVVVVVLFDYRSEVVRFVCCCN